MRLLIILLLNAMVMSPVLAQDRSDKFLHIGDTIPDFEFSLTNYKAGKARMSDFRGKLVILDLWGVRCKGCITTMPKMQALQEEFGNQIQVLMATKDSREDVKELKERIKTVQNNSLPIITGEDSLAHQFDYQFVPTHIWIDKHGVIQSIADSDKATPENVQKFLMGDKPDLGEKVDLILDSEKPLMVELYPHIGDNFSIYSYLAPRVESTVNFSSGSGIRVDENNHIRRIRTTVGTVSRLYRRAYDSTNGWRDSRVLMEFEGAERLKPDHKNLENLFIYDLIVNKDMPREKVFHYMQKQLDLFFGIESSIQKRSMDCYVLQLINDSPSLSVADPDQPTGSQKFQKVLYFENMPWHGVISTLNGHGSDFAPKEVIDETGIDLLKKVDIQMNIDFNDLDKVKKSLEPYGLTIKNDYREFEVIVLSGITD